MRRVFLILLVLAGCRMAHGSQMAFTSGTSSIAACHGGLPVPCALLNTAAQNIVTPATSFTIGTCGAIGNPFIDPNSGERMVEITASSCNVPLIYGCCTTYSSAEAQEWSAYDSTLFSGAGGERVFTIDDEGGYEMFALNFKTGAVCQYTYAGSGSSCNTSGNPNGLTSGTNRANGWKITGWSDASPTVVYGVNSSNTAQVVKYDSTLDKFYTSTNTTSNTVTAFVDFSTCPNQPGISGSYSPSALTERLGDRYLVGAVGGNQQDDTTLMFWYDRTAGNCYWYDAQHGTYGGTGLTTASTSFGQLPTPGTPSLSASPTGSSTMCAVVTGYSQTNSQTTAPQPGYGETLSTSRVCIANGSAGSTYTVTFAGGFSDPYDVTIPGCAASTWSDVSPCTPYRVYMGPSGSEVLQNGGNPVSGPSFSIAAASIVTGTAAPPATQSAGYNIHQALPFHGSNPAVDMTWASSGDTFWIPPSTFYKCNTVYAETNTGCLGHKVTGFNNYLSNVGFPNAAFSPYPISERLLTSPYNPPASPASLMASAQIPIGTASLDMHLSWNDDAGSSDLWPVGVVTYNSHNCSGSLNLNSNSCTQSSPAWVGEILAAATDGTGRVWRFGMTRAGAAPNPSSNFIDFSASSPIGNISQPAPTGAAWYLFSSNWGWSLGGAIDGAQNRTAYPSSTWQSTHLYSAGSNGAPTYLWDGTNFEVNVTGSSCTSGGSQPGWPGASGSVTTDGSCSWKMVTNCNDPNNPPVGVTCQNHVFAVELQ